MDTTTMSLDDLFRSTPTGTIEKAIVNNLKGLNHQQTPSMLPSTRELPGYAFFTRPQLNMRKGNIRNVRQLSALMSDNPVSIQRYIRCLLDPRLHFNYGDEPGEPCPIIDNRNAFIVPFTNQIQTLSGWPSLVVPTKSSEPGLYNESQTIVDGRCIDDTSYTLNATFRNTSGDVTMLAIYAWSIYMSMVAEGKLVPYLDFFAEYELDYNTRIYRFILDHNRKKITKFYSCHAALPKGLDTGSPADLPGDKTYADSTETINVQFAADGVRMFDPIILSDFNAVVEIFNEQMREDYRYNTMTRVPEGLLKIFNFSGYPYVNMETSELEWWVTDEEFDMKSAKYAVNLPRVNAEIFEGD